MKKRLLSALLALALVFVLLPTTALAGETTYSDSEITISGKYWNFGNKGTSGEYAPVYFRSNGTAFQESKPTGSNYLEIKKTGEKEITITVYGTVNLTENESSTNSCISVNSNGVKERNLIITGAAKGSTLNLTCKNNSHPLYSYEGSITINGGVTVNATSQCSNNNNYVSVYGIQVYNSGHNLTISGANTKVNVANKTYDSTVKVDGNITVSDGAQLKAENKSGKVTDNTSKKAYAIECGGQLSISGNNTKVTAKTSNGKQAISGTVSDGDKLTFKVPLAGSTLYQKPMDEALKYTHVEITQAPTDPYVLIAGKPAIMGQETPIPGGTGTYLYKKTTYNGSFLTLKGVDITGTSSGTSSGPAQAIRFGKNGYYTIELEGENKISGFSSGIVAPNDSGVNDVTVVLSGSGSLDISANQYAIDMQVGNLKFENTGKIMLTTGYVFTFPLNALRVKPGSITIDNTKYDIVGARQEKDYPTETISDSIAFTPDLLNGYAVGETTTLFKTITITPAAAKDSTIRYNGTTLKQGETIRNGGTATVDSKNNTITLKNFNGTAALSFDATLADSTLVLEGTNTLSSIVTTQKGLTISGSGSLTVGSIRVTNNDNIRADLTITGGATVIAGTATSDAKAIDITGNLTVNSGATLTATNTSETKPTIDVTGNVTISGDPGTNAYTVSAHNSYNVQKDRVGNLSPSGVPSAIKIGGTLNISAGARVMAQTDSYGAGVMLGQNSTITVEDAFLSAKNSSCDFAAISFSGYMGDINVSGENGKVVAENTHTNIGQSLALKAINAFVYNSNTNFYLKMQSEGVIEEAKNKIIAPGKHDASGGKKVTITRGDAYTTPQVAANYTIAGQTMYVGKYYKTDVNGNITDGTAQDYNIFCDSANDFTLNNATISSTGTGGSTGVIKTNLNYSSAPFHIKLIGTNSINNAGHHAILGEGENSTIFIENAENASNASLTISGNFLPVYSFGNVTINAEVVIINTNGNLISTNKDGHAGAFDLDSGYKCYASTSVSGLPLETYNAAKSSTYKYLRVTKENLAPTTPTPQTPFTIDGIPAQFVDGGMIATTGVTATSSNNINLPIDRVKWYTFTPVFGSDGRMDSVSDKTEATGNFEAGKYYVVEIKFVQDLSPFKSWDMKVSGWSDNDVYRQSVTARNDIEIYFLTPASAATHEHNWAENYDTVYHWKMCTYDGCTAIKDKALHVWNAWHTSNNEQQHWKSCSECSYSTPPHDIDLAYVSDGEQGHHLYCKHDGCTFVTGTTAHVYAEGSNICTDCGYNKSAPCDHTGDRAYTNNGDGTHKVTCKACGATLFEKQNHKFDPATGACVCGATQSGGDPTPDNPGTIVIIRPAEEEKPAQQPNPSTGANDLVGLAVAAAVAAALGSAALLRKHD